MRRAEFEDDDDVVVTEEGDVMTGGTSGSEEDDGGRAGEEQEDAAPPSSDDDDDDGDADEEDNDDDGGDDDDDDEQDATDPRFDLSNDDDDSGTESESDDDDDDARRHGNGAAAPAKNTPHHQHRSTLQKMDTEEQRAMLAGELTPEEALLRVEARELARRARRPQRRHERAAAAAVARLAAALGASMPADGALPHGGARALAGAFMDSLLGREAADLVARSAAAPPPAGVARLGPAALGAAVPEAPLGSGGACEQPAAVVVVDVALALPAGVLEHKDHVGYRYHARRAVYLAAVAAHLAGAGGPPPKENKAAAAKKKQRGVRAGAAAAASGAPSSSSSPPSPFVGWRQQWVAGGAGGGDPTLPRLVLWPPQEQQQQPKRRGGAAPPAPRFVLRVTAVPAAAAALPPHRLHPDRNNVRWVAKPAAAAAGPAAGAPQQQQQKQQQQLKEQQQQQQQLQQQQEAMWLPTPAYNAALLAESHALAHASFLGSAFGGGGASSTGARSEAMADALALLQLWARRAGVAAAPAVGGARPALPPAAALAAGGYASPGPARCPDGLSDHFLAMLLAHCCPAPAGRGGGGGDDDDEDDDDDDEAAAAAAPATTAPPHPLQAARAALRALADAAAWCAPKGVAMARWRVPVPDRDSADPSKHPPSAKAQAKRHEVVFTGPEGWGNVAAGVSAGALAQASAAARRALALLERPAAGAASEALAAVFMDAPPTAAAFDYVWRVRMPPLRVCGGGGGSEGGSAAAATGAAKAAAAAAPTAAAAAALGSDAGRAGLLPGAALHAHAAGDACGGLAREQERRAEGWARRALGDRAALLRALAREPPALPRRGPCPDASRVLGSKRGATVEDESMFLVLPERAEAPAPAPAAAKNRKRTRPAEDEEDDEDDEDEDDLAAAPPPVLIACVADSAQASRLVDVGPAADDPKQATRFRALWGERSELRRLADGRICESVSWAEDGGADARHAIPDLAVSHVLRRHLPRGCEVVGSASALDPALRAPENDEEDEEEDDDDGDAGAAWKKAAAQQQQQAFEDSDAAAVRAAEGALERLARALRSLPQGAGEPGAPPGLPLRVVAALPASAAAGRRTLPFPPRPHPLATAAAASASDRPLADLPSAALGPAAAPFADALLLPSSSSLPLLLPRCLPDPLVLVAQLEGSGRWPDEPRAHAKMKLAMAAQLAAALARAHPASCARAVAVDLDVGPPEGQGAAAAAGAARAATLPSAGEETGDGAGGCVELLWEGFAARVVLQTDRDAAAKQRACAAVQAFAAASAAAAAAGGGGGGGAAPPPLLLLRSDLLRLRAPPEAAVAAAHHGLIAAVAAAHPAFAPTCRLAARWVGCHLAAGPGGGLRHEAVELLVAAVFGRAVAGGGGGGGGGTAASATAALCAPPASRVAGFLRFLHLLEQFAWSHRPLVVDPQGELDGDGAAAAAQAGEASGTAAAAARRQQQQHQRLRAADAAFAARREAAAALRESGGAGAENPANICSSAMFIAAPRDMEISYWTLDGPSDASLARLRAAASRCAAALAAMVERGPGIGAASAQDEAEDALRDARDDDSAWMRALFAPELGFGALLLLRPDALPSAGRALPCARRALARALLAPSARRLPRLDPAVDRSERAVLRGFPRAVVRSQPAARLSSELLVGFEPVSLLAARLSAALGAFATFSADARGGTPCVGVRWRREAFAARPLRAGGALAHCCVPLPAADEGAGKNKMQNKRRRRASAEEEEEQQQQEELMVVPDVAQVLHEAQEIGAGIVDRVLMLV